MQRILRVGIWFALLGPLACFSQNQTNKSSSEGFTLENRQRLEHTQRAIEALNEMDRMIDGMTRRKYAACLMAFENPAFCACLRDRLPIVVDIDGYVSIVTKTKEDLGYATASENDKKMIDLTRRVREQCAPQAH